MVTGKIKRLNTILYCRNWDATVKFYRDVLNFVINHQTDWFVEFQLVGDTYLSIANVVYASIKSVDGDGITLSWQVEDVESAYHLLNKHHRLEYLGRLCPMMQAMRLNHWNLTITPC